MSERGASITEARYQRMRQLCRALNRKRRVLKEKVDLLCGDLVSSNRQFAGTLRDLKRLCEFQNDLIGEFDLTYLCHKTLSAIKRELANSNAAMYLTRDDDFAAHLVDGLCDPDQDIFEIELLLRETIVERVLQSGAEVIIHDEKDWGELPSQQSDMAEGLSCMGFPIGTPEDWAGVVIFYRWADTGFSQEDARPVRMYLEPLGHAVTSLQRLEACLSAIEAESH